MGLFNSLFGKDKKTSGLKEGSAESEPKDSVDPRRNPNLIQVYDKYGRELFVTKEEWRKNVLPEALESNWDNSDQLAGIIIQSLEDGFFADVLKATAQLHQIDTNPARGACVYAICLKENGRLEEAEAVLKSYLDKHGEEGAVLTNLAKIYSVRNDQKKADETLWRGLEVDPNQENGLGWFFAIEHERGGESSGVAALTKIAAIPGSWRAQLWLARDQLKAGNIEEALAHYRAILDHANQPVSSDLLMQMSGDLGNAGRFQELIELAEPQFVVEVHGIQVGNNLIKAYVDVGQIEKAQLILDKLYKLKRLDWKASLGFWDTEIAKARIALDGKNIETPLKMMLLSFEGPIWLKPSSPAADLFSIKLSDDHSICFIGSTVEGQNDEHPIKAQLADAPGRLSRALPFFLAEQVYFRGQARVQTLVSWIADERPGFLLAGGPWEDKHAVEYALKSSVKSEYVVTTHLIARAEPWTAELRLIRGTDAKCLGHLRMTFPSAKPSEVVPGLAQQLLGFLAKETGLEIRPAPLPYQSPERAALNYYLLRLEQLLAVRCADMEGVPKNFLSGLREIIDGNIQLCLDCPENVVTRLVLAQTLTGIKKVQPEILLEFKEKLILLQREYPLPESARSVIEKMFGKVFEV